MLFKKDFSESKEYSRNKNLSLNLINENFEFSFKTTEVSIGVLKICLVMITTFNGFIVSMAFFLIS